MLTDAFDAAPPRPRRLCRIVRDVEGDPELVPAIAAALGWTLTEVRGLMAGEFPPEPGDLETITVAIWQARRPEREAAATIAAGYRLPAENYRRLAGQAQTTA